MVIRRGDKSDGYHLGREEGKPIKPGIPGSEITAGSHGFLALSVNIHWQCDYTLICWNKKTNQLYPEDNYIALPESLSNQLHFLQCCCCYPKELFITQTDMQTFFSLPRTKCAHNFQLQIFIYKYIYFHRKTEILKLAYPNFNTLQYLHKWRTPLDLLH